MTNGGMLDALQRYTQQGREIPDELYKGLALASHIEMQANFADVKSDFAKLSLEVTELKLKVEEPLLCCEQAMTNKEEIDRLRGRNNITDSITAIGIVIATALGLKP